MSRRSKQKHDRRTLRQKISLRKILRFLFSRMVIVGVLIFLQLAFLVALLVTLEGHLVYAYPVLLVLSVGVSVWVVTGEANPAYKLSWVLLISAVPVFGGLFYLMFGNQRTPDDLKARIQQFYDATIQRVHPNFRCWEDLSKVDRDLATEAAYIENVSGFPVWDGTQGEYFPIGEAFAERGASEGTEVYLHGVFHHSGGPDVGPHPGDSQEEGGFRCGSPAALR